MDAVKLTAFSDSDWAGDQSDSKSTGGHVLCLNNCPFIWQSNKQNTVAKSSCASELAAADSCLDDIIWSRDMLTFLGFEQDAATPLMLDNKSTISNIEKGNTTQRNKYFRVRADALHDAYINQLIIPTHLQSELRPVDALTKSLSGPQLLKHKRTMNLCPAGEKLLRSTGPVAMRGT